MEEAKKKSQLSLVPLSGVSLDQVYDFYKHVFENRYKITFDLALWANRSNRIPDHDSPMFLLKNGAIIGQMGMIRENYSINSKIYTVDYGFDFIVSQEYRGRGLGFILIKGTMGIADIGIAFSNNLSGPMGDRTGAMLLRASYHYLKLNPIKGKKYLPRRSFEFLKMFFADTYYKYGRLANKNQAEYILEQANENTLLPFVKTSYTKKDTVFVVKDMDYMKWRVLESPDLRYYRVFGNSGDDKNKLLISIKDPDKIIILMSSDVTDYDAIIKNIASLAYWGIKEGFYTMHYVTANKEFSEMLERSFRHEKTNHPQYQYYSKVPELQSGLKDMQWTLELINSDFEFMQ
jgi:hypothetical protein